MKIAVILLLVSQSILASMTDVIEYSGERIKHGDSVALAESILRMSNAKETTHHLGGYYFFNEKLMMARSWSTDHGTLIFLLDDSDGKMRISKMIHKVEDEIIWTSMRWRGRVRPDHKESQVDEFVIFPRRLLKYILGT